MNNKNIMMMILYIFLGILFLIPQGSLALDYDIGEDKSSIETNENNNNSDYYYDSYVLNSYEVNINVNKNNVLDIEENIGAMFNIEKHGIFRKIPLRNEVIRLDGTTERNKAKISNIYVNDKYTISLENGNKVIKIGSANQTYKGQKNYQIKYNYSLGKDHNKNYDELYFNIIGNEWDTYVQNISFNIHMPKEFDKSKIGFSSGYAASDDSKNIEYNVDGNVINGKYNGVLKPGEGLTVRIELPEGYFEDAGFNINPIDYLIFLIPLIGTLISIYIWHKYGKDDDVVEVVEFYPPEGFNSLEIGYLYKGKANDTDVTSLLVYLANKGYIKIAETENKSLFSKSKGFTITKLKEYDGNNENERIFLDGLFKTEKHVDHDKVRDLIKEYKKQGQELDFNKAVAMCSNSKSKTSVTDLDLYDSFYITVNEIESNIDNKENREKIFEKNVAKKYPIIIMCLILSLIIATIIPTLAYSSLKEYIYIIPLIIIYVPFLIFGINMKKSFMKVFMLIFIATHCVGMLSGTSLGQALFYDSFYRHGFIFAIINVVIMIIMMKYLPKRTKYGNEILGKILGFKKFLETAEKENLESMVMQNPSYFYDILPYTYVLGVSEKWIEKFETIALQAPTWYEGVGNFDMTSFGNSLTRTMNNATTVMSSSPSSSSGSSGGGCSGGGSGGGGGGSW